jgi:thiol:disulfide interchange protein
MRISRIAITFAAFVLLFVAAGKTNGQEATVDTGKAEAEVVAKATAPFQTDLDTALNAATQTDRNILLDFYTDW